MDPSKENPIVIEPNRKRVRVHFNGHLVADTTRAKRVVKAVEVACGARERRLDRAARSR